MVTLTDIKRVVVEPVQIPDGRYPGHQSGYEVTFVVGDVKYTGKSSWGARGLNCPCTVVVRDGVFTVEI